MLSVKRFLRTNKILFLRTTTTGSEAAALRHGHANPHQHPPLFDSQYYESANKQLVLCRGDQLLCVFPRTLYIHELFKTTLDYVDTFTSSMGLAMVLRCNGPDALTIPAGVPFNWVLAHAFISANYVALNVGSFNVLENMREEYCRDSHAYYMEKTFYMNGDDDDDEEEDEVD